MSPAEVIRVPDDRIEVVTIPHPFSLERQRHAVARYLTVQEIVDLQHFPKWVFPAVWLDDRYLPRRCWPHVRVRPPHVLTIRAVPAGGGGGQRGQQDKDKTLRVVLQVVVVIIAVVIVALTAGTAAAAAGVIIAAVFTVAANLAIMALLPPPEFSFDGFTDKSKASPFITGARNQALLYGPIPRPYGLHRMFPPYGAVPVTEIAGDAQYLRMLFVPGYGPLDVTDLRIGPTPLTQFTDVEYIIRPGYLTDPPLSLYANDFAEDALSIHLTNTEYVARFTREKADEISVDVAFPFGVYGLGNRGIEAADAAVQIEYRLVGDPDWILAGVIYENNQTQHHIARSFKWSVTTGQYEVRLIRQDAEMTEEGRDEVWWTVIRTIRHTTPITLAGLCTVEMRIKATDQLQGIIDSFNCVVQSILPDWDTASSTWITRATSNPASIYRDVLQGRANARPVADSRLDLTELQDWHAENVTANRMFNGIFDGDTTIVGAMKQVAAIGRASPHFKDDKYSVVRDVPQTVPSALFSTRNSWGLRVTKSFVDRPHAIKARFANAAADYQQDERVVYDDGFDITNATKFDAMDLFGVTNADQAWKAVRYHLGALKLRPEVFSINTDFEFVVARRGELVKLQHDVILVGLAVGRIKALGTSGANITTVTVDETFTMAAGTNYAIRVRKSDGAHVLAPILTAAGDQHTVTLNPPIPIAGGPAAGDLCVFGESGLETLDAIIKAILPGPDLTAQVLLVDAAPDIHLAETGPIPAYQTHITTPVVIIRRPPQPIVDSVRSDEEALVRDADGALRLGIQVALHYASGGQVIPLALQAQLRRTGAIDWDAPQLFAGQTTVITMLGVEEGAAYDLRVRSIGPAGETSEWTMITGHIVIGTVTPPPDIPMALLEGNLLKWSYENPPLDLAGFVIRRHLSARQTWEDAQPIMGGGDRIALTDTMFPLPLEATGLTTYLIKAIDIGGHESVNPAIVVVNLGDPLVENLLFTYDYVANGYPGTITNGTVVVGVLEANAAAAFWPADNAKRFWPN